MTVLAYSDSCSLTLRFPNMEALLPFLAKRWGENVMAIANTDPTDLRVLTVWKDLESYLSSTEGDTLASPVATVRHMEEEKAKDLLFSTHNESDWN